MSTLCKIKKKKKRKKHAEEAIGADATHQCQKCKLMACRKKLLCKPKKR